MRIILIREEDIKPTDTWMHRIKDKNDLMIASVIILIKKDGTYQPVKNRYGSDELIGVFGEILDLTIYKED